MDLHNKLVFIVEDDAGGLAVASHYLRQAGAQILYLRWGEDIPAQIERSMPVDVILMDLMLPRQMSGFDVFTDLQKNEKLAAVPVIAVSSMDPDIAMPRAKTLGFAGFIAKPVSPAIVRHVIAALEGKKVWIGDSRN
jgi:CheY-like chemotaxis protein